MKSVVSIVSLALLTSSAEAHPIWAPCSRGNACEYSNQGGCCLKATYFSHWFNKDESSIEHICVDKESVEFIRSDGVGKKHTSEDSMRFYYMYGNHKYFFPPPFFTVPDPLPSFNTWLNWTEFTTGNNIDY